MKATLKRLMTLLSSRLPPGAQDALIEGVLASSDGWRTLDRVARKCGLKGVEVAGDLGRIVGDPADEAILRSYARTGRWADRTIGLLLSFFGRSEGQYVDVGANIGLTTIPIAARTLAKCVAIEPDPTNFSHLLTNVRANCPDAEVEFHQVAVMDRNGMADLALSPDNLGDHRVRVAGAPRGVLGEDSWQTTRVECRALDEIVRLSGKPLAVKIDVQGAEPFVFAGGQGTLSRADMVVVEWSPYWMRMMNADPEAVVRLLASSFRQLSIAEGETGEMRPAESPARGAERLLELYDQHKESFGPYFDVMARK